MCSSDLDSYLKKVLMEARPEYGWLSEETVDSPDRLNKDRVWVVDPLDGTKEFIEGVPNFVVSVALVENGMPIVGVLYNPVTKETFTADRKSTRLNSSHALISYAVFCLKKKTKQKTNKQKTKKMRSQH